MSWAQFRIGRLEKMSRGLMIGYGQRLGGRGGGLGQARVPNSFCLQSLNIYTAASVAIPHLLSAKVLSEEGGKIDPKNIPLKSFLIFVH